MYLLDLLAPSRTLEVHNKITVPVEPFYCTTTGGSGLNRLINPIHRLDFRCFFLKQSAGHREIHSQVMDLKNGTLGRSVQWSSSFR